MHDTCNLHMVFREQVVIQCFNGCLWVLRAQESGKDQSHKKFANKVSELTRCET
jgi:hypothetical protein